MRKPLWLAIGLGVGLTLVQISIAWAHAALLRAVPTPNGFYPPTDPPTQVKLTFSEEVVPTFGVIQVLNQFGEVVDNGDVQAVNPERTVLAVSLKPLPQGTYTVAWEVLSAIDGHSTSGSYVFGVGVKAPTLVDTTSATPGASPASLGARWLTLTGQIILLGLFAFRALVWGPTLTPNANEELDVAMARQAIRVGWVGLGLVGFGLLLTLVAQWEALRASTFSGLITNIRAWFGTRFGGMWVVRFWLAVGLAFGLADLGLGVQAGRSGLKGWGWWAGLALSATLGLTITFTSHSAALQEGRPLAVVSDAAHLLAAGAWVGGLVQLVIATRLTRALPGEARLHHNLNLILNFSAMAAIAVGVLLMSGSYLAWQHVGTWATLFKTAHGQTLLVKTALALPAFAIASLNLLVVKPRLAAAISQPEPAQNLIPKRFNRLVLTEASLALAIVAAAGFLTDFPRGREALLLAEQSQATLVQSADDLNLTLTITPARWGQESVFDVFLRDADGKPLSNAREVSLRFTFGDGVLGRNEVMAEAAGDGRYRAQCNCLSLGGTWEIEIAIRRWNAFDTFATFQLNTDTDGVIRPQDTSVVGGERIIRWLTRAGGWITSGALILFSLVWVIPAVQAARGNVSLTLVLLPSFIAMIVGVVQLVEAINGKPLALVSDPHALALLTESDAAMNRLTSVQLLRTTRGDSGAGITETVVFQAPNLFHTVFSNGAETLAQGRMYYYRDLGKTVWQAVRQNEAFTFPNFDLSREAVGAKLGGIEMVNGRRTQTVRYIFYILRSPIAFTRWIDPETKFIVQEYMDAPGHHMLSVYHDYNQPVTITVPAPSEIGPTPTAITP